jgi:hypothetical protein
MSVAQIEINSSLLSGPELKKAVSGVNAGTATATDINASNISLEDKAVLKDVLASTATRVSINSRDISLPLKAVCLKIAGV